MCDLFFLIFSAMPVIAWDVQNENLGEVKICKITKPIDDGVIMIEMSELFQGVVFTAFSLDVLDMF